MSAPQPIRMTRQNPSIWSARAPLALVVLLSIVFASSTAAAQVNVSFDSTGYPDQLALEMALVDADNNDDNIQELFVQPDGEWLFITDNSFEHSANFHTGARIAAEARWSIYNETIDAVASASDGSYVVVANGVRYSYLTPAQDPALLEWLIDSYLSLHGSIDELVFDSDGAGWAISSGEFSYAHQMPDDFTDAWLDTNETDRAVRAMSINAAGDWVLQAANWFASGGAIQPFRFELAQQNLLERGIDHVHYNDAGGYVIASNGDYGYGADVLDQIEADIDPAATTKPLWDALLNENIIGLSIAYFDDGELTARRGYGLKQDFPSRYKGERWVGVDTRFEFASVSKSVAAATALAVMSDPTQNLTLETPVSSVGDPSSALQRWISGGQVLYNTVFPGSMKVKHLLSHTSGLEGRETTTAGKDWDSVAYFAWDDNKPGPFKLLIGTDGDDCSSTSCSSPSDADDILWCGSDSTGFVVPGESDYYSGGGYTALEAVLAATTGFLFPTTAEYRIFSPLGMSRSTYLSPSDEWGTGDTMMQHRLSGGGVIAKTFPGVMFHHAAASLVSTPTDVGRVGVMIGAGGLPEPSAPEAERVIDANLVTQMVSPAVRNNGSLVNYGLGLAMKSTANCLNGDGTAKIVWHTGSNGSARALIAINRHTDEVIVVSFAAADSTSAENFTNTLYPALIDVLGWDDSCIL